MCAVLNVEANADLRNNQEEKRFIYRDENFDYTLAYVGKYTYCHDLMIDNGIRFQNLDTNGFCYNLHIGNFCSIASGNSIISGRNHNYKTISTGALEVALSNAGIKKNVPNSTFKRRGTVLIQNDVWIGANCTLMSGVKIGNGAVIARNSHVVKDVPAYSIVGGNPAKIIGYRYSPELIRKLNVIQWWNWSNEKLLNNYELFNEDVETFCNLFFDEAMEDFLPLQKKHEERDKDAYFSLLDVYENYPVFLNILDEFLNEFSDNEDKKLYFFVNEKMDCTDKVVLTLDSLIQLVKRISETPSIKCEVELIGGDSRKAIDILTRCSHYIMCRTYDTVFISCLADNLGIELISGVDKPIFRKVSNLIKG